jgi:hypothetical protein
VRERDGLERRRHRRRHLLVLAGGHLLLSSILFWGGIAGICAFREGWGGNWEDVCAGVDVPEEARRGRVGDESDGPDSARLC